MLDEGTRMGDVWVLRALREKIVPLRPSRGSESLFVRQIHDIVTYYLEICGEQNCPAIRWETLDAACRCATEVEEVGAIKDLHIGDEALKELISRSHVCSCGSCYPLRRGALMLAAYQGNSRVVQHLGKMMCLAGSDDSYSYMLASPIAAAAAGGHLEIIKQLDEIFPASRDWIQRTREISLAVATTQGSESLVQYFLDNTDCELEDLHWFYYPTLRKAAIHNAILSLRCLVESLRERLVIGPCHLITCDNDATYYQERFEMSLARALKDVCFRGAEGSVQLLLEQGADPNWADDHFRAHSYGNARSGDGWRALHYAARHGFLKIVEMLLAAGAHPGPVRYAFVRSNGRRLSRDDSTSGPIINAQPLYLAARRGHIDIMKALLNAGASVYGMARFSWLGPNRISPARVRRELAELDSHSALSAAASEGQVEGIELLMQHGFRFDSLHRGRRAMGEARKNGHASAYEALARYTKKPGTWKMCIKNLTTKDREFVKESRTAAFAKDALFRLRLNIAWGLE